MPKITPLLATLLNTASRNTHAAAAKMESVRHRHQPSGLNSMQPLTLTWQAHRHATDRQMDKQTSLSMLNVTYLSITRVRIMIGN